ncbi:MAG: cobamide remodeling phosphodiesterase CbiR [Desulfobacteraceae bacterium]|jgi:sugar phosphate isomerase/epimerase
MKLQSSSDSIKRSYKNFYPFRLATTSFIYQDTWVPNVRRLGPYLDEVELLLFDKGIDNYPTPFEIRELARSANEMNFTYNIHQPIDIYLGHKDTLERKSAVDTVKEIFDLTSQLPVSTHIIHVVWLEDNSDKTIMAKWCERVRESFESLIASGIPSSAIAVETLDYPINWLDQIISDLNLSVCLDLGHLWLANEDPLAIYNTYKEQTSVLHLHGVEQEKDHLSLTKLDKNRRNTVKQILSDFKGIVSLEVFSFKALESSLTTLETICQTM